MNVIFGSGVIGALAKRMLGPSWKLVPFYRSRFFSFNPALDDNFIIRDDELDPFIADIIGSKPQIFLYPRAFSISGELLRQYSSGICEDWLLKIFGAKYPNHALPYHTSRMTLSIYNVRINQLYTALLNDMADDIKAEAAKGLVTTIGDHYYIRNGVREDFDYAISTIPLPALYKLLNKSDGQYVSKPLHYLHVQTPDLNFEGNNQVFVVDKLLSFFKVTNIAPNRYMFYFHEQVENPGAYLMGFMQKFDILDGTSIPDALPLGNMPKLDFLESYGIYPIGSYAQWDWCADVGSCLLRLLRYSKRDFKLRPVRSI